MAAPPLMFLFTALILWACLRGSGVIMKVTGQSGIDAISRLMGFLLVCMGAQFVINGTWKSCRPSSTTTATCSTNEVSSWQRTRKTLLKKARN